MLQELRRACNTVSDSSMKILTERLPSKANLWLFMRNRRLLVQPVYWQPPDSHLINNINTPTSLTGLSSITSFKAIDSHLATNKSASVNTRTQVASFIPQGASRPLEVREVRRARGPLNGRGRDRL